MGSYSNRLILNESNDSYEPIIDIEQPVNIHSYRPIKPNIEDTIFPIEPIQMSKSVGSLSYSNSSENLPFITHNTIHDYQFESNKISLKYKESEDQKELLNILSLMKDKNTGIKIRDHHRLNKVINNCCSGYDLVEWILNNIKSIQTRRKAINMLQKMIENDYIYHYKFHLTFKDMKDEFYLFKDLDDEIVNSYDNDENRFYEFNKYQFYSQSLKMVISLMKKELNIKDRNLFDSKTKTSKIYFQCFEGTESIDWLVLNKKIFNTDSSKLFMNLLLLAEIISAIGDEMESKYKIKNIMSNSKIQSLSSSNKDLSIFNLRNYYRFNDDEIRNEKVNENYKYNIENVFKTLNEMISNINSKIDDSNDQNVFNYWEELSPGKEKFIIESDANYGSLESQSDYE